MVEFFRDFIAECKRVIWPNKEELTRLTLNVLGLSIIVGIIIYIMEFFVSGGITLIERAIQGLA